MQPQACLPLLTATEWGWLPAWHSRACSCSCSLEMNKTCVRSSSRQSPTPSLHGQGYQRPTLMGYGPQKSRVHSTQFKVQRGQCPRVHAVGDQERQVSQ